MFFAASAAILNNTHIFVNKGSIFLYHLGLISNLSFGGLIISIVNSHLHPNCKKIHLDWKLFIPSFLYLPFIALCIIEPHWSTDTITLSEAGKMSLFATLYNLIIVFYSIGANVYLLWKCRNIQSAFESGYIKKINEFLWMLLVLQLVAFVPFILKLDITYIILYMPIIGQLFFIYIFIKASLSMEVFEYQTKAINENTVKYVTIKVNDDKTEKIRSQIIELMNRERPYLKVDYTLTEMAKELKVLPNTLSMVINSKLNCSFPEYVNSLRVKTALELLEKASDNNLTIEAISYESGFNNRTSFYNAFKKVTGKLPSEYLKKEVKIKEAVR